MVTSGGNEGAGGCYCNELVLALERGFERRQRGFRLAPQRIQRKRGLIAPLEGLAVVGKDGCKRRRRVGSHARQGARYSAFGSKALVRALCFELVITEQFDQCRHKRLTIRAERFCRADGRGSNLRTGVLERSANKLQERIVRFRSPGKIVEQCRTFLERCTLVLDNGANGSDSVPTDGQERSSDQLSAKTAFVGFFLSFEERGHSALGAWAKNGNGAGSTLQITLPAGALGLGRFLERCDQIRQCFLGKLVAATGIDFQCRIHRGLTNTVGHVEAQAVSEIGAVFGCFEEIGKSVFRGRTDLREGHACENTGV